MIWFYHFRLRLDSGIARGGVTVAVEEREDGQYGVATAVCSPLDNFNRKRGCAIAAGRLHSERCIESGKVLMFPAAIMKDREDRFRCAEKRAVFAFGDAHANHQWPMMGMAYALESKQEVDRG
ncbi:MAG: hypothetical protein JRL30_00795 [Deltaproteobacteria bacterium]|nr:hypothetical protein [Deltaproteobacteria bacterium]